MAAPTFKQIRFRLFETTSRRWRGAISIAPPLTFTDLAWDLPATDIIDLDKSVGLLLDTDDIRIEKREEEDGKIIVTDISEITLLSLNKLKGVSDSVPVDYDLGADQITLWEHLLLALNDGQSIATLRLSYQKPDDSWSQEFFFDFKREDVKFSDIPAGYKLGTTEEYCFKKVTIRCAPVWKRLESATLGDLENDPDFAFQKEDTINYALSALFHQGLPLFGGLKVNHIVPSTTGWGDAVRRFRLGEDVIFNNSGGVQANADLLIQIQPPDLSTVTIDGKVYTWQTSLSNVDGHVLIGGSLRQAVRNLAAAIGLTAGGAGVTYAAATTLHPTVHIDHIQEPAGYSLSRMFIAYNTSGTAGNSVAVAYSPSGGANHWEYSGAIATTLAGGTSSTSLLYDYFDTTYYSEQINLGSTTFPRHFWYLSVFTIFQRILNYVGIKLETSDYDPLPLKSFQQKFDQDTGLFSIDEDTAEDDIANIGINYNVWFGRHPNFGTRSDNTDHGFSTPITYTQSTPLKTIISEWLVWCGYCLDTYLDTDGEPRAFLRERGKKGAILPDSWNAKTGLESTEEDFIPARPLVLSNKGDNDKIYIPKKPKDQDQKTEIIIPARTRAFGDTTTGDIHGRHLMYDYSFDITEQGHAHFSQEAVDGFPMAIGNFPQGWLLASYMLSFRTLSEEQNNDNLPDPDAPNNFPNRGIDVPEDWRGFYPLNIVQYKDDTTARTSQNYNFGESYIYAIGQFYANRLGVAPAIQLTRTFSRIDDDSGDIKFTKLGIYTNPHRNGVDKILVGTKITMYLRAEYCTVTFREQVDSESLVTLPVFTDSSNNSIGSGSASISGGGGTGGGGGGAVVTDYLSTIPATNDRNIAQSQLDVLALILRGFIGGQTVDLFQVQSSDGASVSSGIDSLGGFYTKLLKAFSLFQYGSGSYETGQARFYGYASAGTAHFSLQANPAIATDQEIILPEIFPIWTNAILQIQSISGSRIIVEWADPSALVPSVNVLWKYPDNDTRNDVIPAGDYTGIRIFQQNATGFELIARSGADGSQTLFNVLDNSLGLLFKIDEIGRITQGTAGGGAYNGFTNEVAFIPNSTAVAGGSSNNNLSIGRFTTMRLVLSGGSGGITITGIDSGTLAGRMLYLINETGETVTLPHLSGSSSGSNQFFNGAGGGSVVLGDGDSVTYIYDNSLNHWFLLSGTTVGSSLLYWSEAQSTASPNNVVYATSWSVVTGGADSDAVIAPKGNGGLQLQVADSTTTGGDKRGINAIDFSMLRSNANEVASGTASMQWGVSNKTTGTYGTTGGVGNDNAAGLGFVFGSGNVSTGGTTEVYIFGDSHLSIKDYTNLFGLEGYAYLYGQTVFGTGTIVSQGDSQSWRNNIKASTTNNTATEMFIDAPAGSERLVLRDNTAWSFRARINALRDDLTQADGWECVGVIKRAVGASNVAIVGTPPPIPSLTGSATSWTVAVSADTTNGSLKFTVTGENSKNIKWTGSIEVSETGW